MFVIHNLVLVLIFFICFKCVFSKIDSSDAEIDTEGYLGDTEEEEMELPNDDNAFTTMAQTSKEKRCVDNQLRGMLAECSEYKKRLLSLVNVTERLDQTNGLKNWCLQSKCLSDNMNQFLMKPLPVGGTLSLQNIVIIERDRLHEYLHDYLQKALEIPFPSSSLDIP